MTWWEILLLIFGPPLLLVALFAVLGLVFLGDQPEDWR